MTMSKFVVRLPQTVHLTLKKDAQRLGCSLNELCIGRLNLPSLAEAVTPLMRQSILQLAGIASDKLVGIVIFGSWARHDSHDLSDIDILIVLQEGTPITRDLYRQWEAVESKDDKIEPHFVALPAANKPVSSLWAEISLDGLMIYDRDFSLQSYLGKVRRLIAAGKLIAKRLHGQNYWVHTEVA